MKHDPSCSHSPQSLRIQCKLLSDVAEHGTSFGTSIVPYRGMSIVFNFMRLISPRKKKIQLHSPLSDVLVLPCRDFNFSSSRDHHEERVLQRDFGGNPKKKKDKRKRKRKQTSLAEAIASHSLKTHMTIGYCKETTIQHVYEGLSFKTLINPPVPIPVFRRYQSQGISRDSDLRRYAEIYMCVPQGPPE